LGFLYVFALRRTRLGAKAMDIVNGILATSAPLKASEVYIDYAKIRIGFWVGIRVRVSGVRVVLEWTPRSDWDAATQAVQDGVKKAMLAALQAQLGSVQSDLKPPGCFGTRSKGIVERILNHVDVQISGVNILIPCGDVPVELRLPKLSIGLSRSWAFEQGGTQLSLGGTLNIRAAGEDLLEPLPLQVHVKMPRLLRTLLSKSNAPKILKKKKLDVSVTIQAIKLCLRPRAIGNILKASDNLAQFSAWKAPIADEVQEELMTLNSTDRPKYVAALKAKNKKEIASWEERIHLRDALAVHSEMEKWPIPEGQSIEEWLGELSIRQLPTRDVKYSVSVKSFNLEVLTDEWRRGQGVAIVVESLSLSGDVNIASAAEQPTALTVKPMALLVDTKILLNSLRIMSEKLGTFCNPVLEPCSIAVAFTADKESLSVKFTLQEVEVQDYFVSLSVSPRAIYKLECIAAAFAQALPPKAPPSRESAMLKVRARERAHRDDVARRFAKYDQDNSGELGQGEIYALVNELFRDKMTAEELQAAGSQLYSQLDRDNSGGVSLEELQDYFKQAEAGSAKGAIRIKLGEYAHALPEDFDAWYDFENKILQMLTKDEDINTISMKLLQLRWVRTCLNYTAAEKTWFDVIAPRLTRKDTDWLLSVHEEATDFWNNPILLGDLDVREEEIKAYKINIEFEVSGLSLRYSDYQVPFGAPRVRVDLSAVKVAGSVMPPCVAEPQIDFDLKGGLHLKAAYWNEEHARSEPLLEDWNIDLLCEGSSFKVAAPKHMVINLTPPLLQAVGVLKDSLTVAGKKRSAVLQQIPPDYETEAENAACWVVNLTGRDLKVCCVGPGGKGKVVVLKKELRDKPMKVELNAKKLKGYQLKEQDSFHLEFESVTRGEFSIQEKVSFGVAGRRVHSIPKLNRYMVADVCLDVLTQAPVITLSGLVTITNATPDVVSIDVQIGSIKLGAGETYCAGLGGGGRMLVGDLVVPLPDDKVVREVSGLTGDNIQGPIWKKVTGEARGIREWQEHLMKTVGLRAYWDLRPVINSDKIKTLSMVLVSMVCVSNYLPSSIKCCAKMGPPLTKPGLVGKSFHADIHDKLEEHVKDEDLIKEVKPGGTVGFTAIAKSEYIIVPFTFEGHSYCAAVKMEVMGKQGVRKLRKRVTRGSLTKAKVHKFKDESPYIDCMMEWSGDTACLVLFPRWLIANRTGRNVALTAGSRFSGQGKFEHVNCWTMVNAPWPAAQKLPPVYGLMHISKGYAKVGQFAFRLGSPSDEEWGWDAAKAKGKLLHFPTLPVATEEGATQEDLTSDWSEPIPATIATSAAVECKALSHSGLGGGTVGVAVEELPFPFERTRLIQIAPRFVVVNRLNQAIKLWPCRATSRHPSQGVVPADLPVAVGGGSYVAIDDILHTQFHMIPSYSSTEEPMVSFRLDDEKMDEVEKSVREFRESELQGSGLSIEEMRKHAAQISQHVTSAGTRATRRVKSGLRKGVKRLRDTSTQRAQQATMAAVNTTTAAEGAAQALQDTAEAAQGAADFVSGVCDVLVNDLGEIDIPKGFWSTNVPLWRPGDTICAIQKRIAVDDEDSLQEVVFRASMQQEGSTNFIVISEGSYPFCIQNRSATTTLVFSQVGDQTGAPEMVVKPCAYERFVFPDPDAPQVLNGRIRGAGQKNVVEYSFEDLSHPVTPPLCYIGQLGEKIVALEARMQLDGSIGTLTFHNPGSVVIREEQEDGLKTVQLLNTVVTSLEVRIFMAGIHLCLVDTSQANQIDELLAVTVDYVEIRKLRGEEEVELDVYHVQVDDFHSPGRFILGPRNSGLNSRRHYAVEATEDTGHPLFNVSFGWNDLEATVTNAGKGIYMIEHFSLELMPMEVFLDVPKLLQIANNLLAWTSVNKQFIPDSQAAGTRVLTHKFAPGISTPSSEGAKLMFLDELEVGVISLECHIRFSSQRGEVTKEDEDGGNTDEKLSSLMSALPPAAQPVLGGLSHASLSFADISPTFRFGKFTKPNLYGSIGPIVNSIKDNYVKQVLQQAVMVIGSVKLLGDPTKVVGDVSKGFNVMIKETSKELRGEKNVRLRGVIEFVETVVGSGLGAIADSTGALKDTIGGIAGRPIGNEYLPQDLAEGIDGGMSVFAEGFSHAISDVVLIPKAKLESEDYEHRPIQGVLIGSAQGVYAIFARPIEGTLGSLEKFARGAQNSVHGRARGFDGWRRPLRQGFFEQNGLLQLEEGLFWPSWRIKLLGVSLSSLWEERRVSQVTISLEKRSQGKTDQQIQLDRAESEDVWLAIPRPGYPWLEKEEAAGRVGDLIAPMRLQVDALLQGNVGMIEPLRQTVGFGKLNTQDFLEALAKYTPQSEGSSVLTVHVEIEATKSQIEGGLHKEGEVIGDVKFQFSAEVDAKVTPAGLTPAKGGVALAGDDIDNAVSAANGDARTAASIKHSG